VAAVVFVVLSPQRIPRLATAAVGVAGGLLLVVETRHRSALAHGLTTSTASHQGRTVLVLLIVVCLVVAVVQALISLGVGRVRSPSALSVPLRPARTATIALVVIGIAAALALGVPHHLNTVWEHFKQPNNVSALVNPLGRLTTLSGDGRYTFWKTAIDALPGHWLNGFGVGTFQLVWLPRAPFGAYIVNAHSLYVETLTEVGLVGLALLVAFLVTAVAAAARRVADADPAARCLAAAITAAIVAFLVSAAFDWIWQVPVEPVALLLLAAAVAGPATGVVRAPARRLARVGGRMAAVLAAVGCLILIGVPLAMTQAVRRSQADANAGNDAAALSAAETAVNIEPGAASPAIQAALVLEIEGRYTAALSYARQATANEPQNWQTWLVRSRLEAEAGNAGQSVTAYERARSLNPHSSLFQT
jgi:hypothetical protein